MLPPLGANCRVVSRNAESPFIPLLDQGMPLQVALRNGGHFFPTDRHGRMLNRRYVSLDSQLHEVMMLQPEIEERHDQL